MDSIFDLIIVGAGISGINTAYRVQTLIPGYKYAILEARDAIGGTWDLFTYPGVRSDSDLHTFGFSWRPWPERQAIADAESIKKYMNDTVAIHGIDRHIQFHKKLLAADWSSETDLWRLQVDAGGEKEIIYTRFIVFGTGYYDYKDPLPATITGIENFKGQVIHPQFWPKDLDYTGKKVVIVGSGATAVTLLPNLVEKASHVTMLQRSPSYVFTRPTSDLLERFAERWLPGQIGRKFSRWKNLVLGSLLYQWCQAFPQAAKNLFRRMTTKELPSNIPHDPHFKPAYNPWEQRMCITPDGDFWEALRGEKANVVTGHIQDIKETTIILESGEEVEADILITATGLKLQIGGGVPASVDGHHIVPREKFLWRSALMQDLPNAAFMIGYTNASWTPGADATGRLLCRILIHMKKQGLTSVVPRVDDPSRLNVVPILNLKSTYIRAASSILPMAADSGPWRPRVNYFLDWWTAKFGDITTGLVYSKVSS